MTDKARPYDSLPAVPDLAQIVRQTLNGVREVTEMVDYYATCEGDFAVTRAATDAERQEYSRSDPSLGARVQRDFQENNALLQRLATARYG